ncbi:MAG: hypothetical protein EOM55_03140 [Clostridia bacterium]|nr:hypothetical protein [Clostridia bacterium]
MKIINNIKVKLLSKKEKKRKFFWIIKISLLAFSLSILLSFFSQIVLKKSNAILAVVLLCIFMIFNIFSDMIGLAITSCQIDEVRKERENNRLKESIYKKCLHLIKNSDKVSSILCDVVGDICGILCGVSATILTNIIISNNSIFSLYLFVGAIVSSIIAGLTVCFKAIAKNFAVKNSLKIVIKISKISLIFFK